MAKIPYKTYLSEEQLPQQWYNLRADMKTQPAPMISPANFQPLKPEDLHPIFAEELCRQEFDATTRFIDIPGPVYDYYRTYRPSPLVRAYNLEKALDTPARIYFKFEGNNTSGSHKLNSAAPQAYFAKQQGLQGLTTETGAGQWGTAMAMSCAHFGLDLKVFMVKTSSEQKPYRKVVMQTYGADVTASPSNTTQVGRSILERYPNTGGSLGCAISEAIEAAVTNPGYRYVLGSMLNHVLLHQSVIGLEAKAAMDQLGEYPDIVIGCAGGGSNMGGLMSTYMADRLSGKANPYFIAIEPASCPSMTRGRYAYDFGDTGHTTPLVKMYTLGSDFIPSPNHAGGLRFHGMSPILSQLYLDGYLDEARSAEQTSVFEAATLFARVETILPAPESAHAIRAAIDEAIKCRESGQTKVILFSLSGTGYFDLTAYSSYLTHTMTDYIPTDEDLQKGFATLPQVPEGK
ncbi:MAG: TrpB-like pyridoxal phosphate-dependent enzyme [Oscillospiraceae bacterium]|jgi:tryptophan synthase beta chain|nr:TrpB-like pyridoxal phosphate-dependent enzyme [Oscillospiraceae bacterium]